MRPRPDLDRLRDDLALIDAACEAMRIGEFDLFRRAFRAWFGVEPDEKRLEAVFVAYLFHREVPGWLRHFCRRVVDEQAAEAPPSPAPADAIEAPRRLAALAVVAATVFLFVAALTGNASPSCAGASADTVEGLARLVTADAGLPAC